MAIKVKYDKCFKDIFELYGYRPFNIKELRYKIEVPINDLYAVLQQLCGRSRMRIRGQIEPNAKIKKIMKGWYQINEPKDKSDSDPE